MINNIYDKVDKYIYEHKYYQAIKYISKQLEKKADDWYLLVNLSSAYYESMDYNNAYVYILRALKVIGPRPLVLWHIAGTLEMLGKKQDAIILWKELIKRGENKIAAEEETSIIWARSVINDCYYRIGLAYKRLGKKGYSKRYFAIYMKNIQMKVPSIYTRKEALKEIL